MVEINNQYHTRRASRDRKTDFQVTGPRVANQDFTLAFWLKFPTAPTGDYWHYLDLHPCATNNTRLEFYNVQGNMYGRFMVPDGAGGSHTVYKLLGAHGTDAWHHYALTRKGTTVTFYFDGASAGSDTDANNYRNLIDSGDRLLIGWYSGAVMDDLRALRKGLTSAELGQLYNSGAGTAALDAQQYAWDALNRLREARDPNTGALAAGYLYDADNRRVRKTLAGPLDGCGGGGAVGAGAGGATGPATDYFYDGWRVLEERDGTTTATIRRQFVYGNYLDEALVMDVDTDADGSCVDSGGSARYFYHQNTLFSVCAVTDSTGKIVEAYEYDPYGRHVLLRDGNSDGRVNFNATDLRLSSGGSSTLNPQSQIGNPYTFTGQRFDAETGLHYYKERYYSSSQGRFISRDPIGFTGGKHLYAYAASEPTSRVDPLGEWNSEVHIDLTVLYARRYYNHPYLMAIADINVDNVPRGYLPQWLLGLGQQGRHLNTQPTGSGMDSRDDWAKKEYAEAGRLIRKGKCLEAVEAFGRGLHSKQDIPCHRNWPVKGEGWKGVVAHPGWWDYFGDLESVNAKSLWQYMWYMPWDDSWWTVNAYNKKWPADYWPWSGKQEQIDSQKKAIRGAYTVTETEVPRFAGIVMQNDTKCFCRKLLLKDKPDIPPPLELPPIPPSPPELPAF